jgi:alpha-L-rhamnosidase
MLNLQESFIQMLKRIILLNILLVIVSPVFTQEIQSSLLQKPWEADWIASPDADARGYSIQYFRKELPLDVIPGKFIVHVSADNRYKLYVNGLFVSNGPARGELYHWNFETVDLAPFFKQGNNIISALVWNYGEESPEAQISFRTAFILQGDGKNEAILNTNKTWLTYKDKSYKPLNPELIYTYYAAGPGEQIDFRVYPSGWTNINYDTREWKPAQELFNGLPKGVFGWTNGWNEKNKTFIISPGMKG